MTKKEYNILSFYLTRVLFIGSGFPIMIDIDILFYSLFIKRKCIM